MINLFLFITFAFPKAGIKIDNIPLTVQMVLFVICVVLSIKVFTKIYEKMKSFAYSYILFSVILLLVAILNFKNIKSFYLLVTMVLITSPLAICIGYKANYNKAIKIMCIALIITGVYSLLQWSIGIEKTKIPGINIAYGDSFAYKSIGYGFFGAEALKMPSTYQNGNLVGIFYILGIACMLEWTTEERKYMIMKYVSIILATIGIVLSGSRTIMAIFILMVVLIISNIFKTKKEMRKKYLRIIGAILIITIIVCITIYIIDKKDIDTLIYRYVTQTIMDKTASGRTIQLKNLFNSIAQANIFEKIRTLLLGMDWSNVKQVEGLFYILSFYGGIAFVTLIALFCIVIRNVYKTNKTISIALSVVLIAFFVDSSFNYPPILINYFLIVGMYIKKNEFLLQSKEDNKYEEVAKE